MYHCPYSDINVLHVIRVRAACCDISNLVFIACNGHMSDVDCPMEFALWPTSKGNYIVYANFVCLVGLPAPLSVHYLCTHDTKQFPISYFLFLDLQFQTLSFAD